MGHRIVISGYRKVIATPSGGDYCPTNYESW